MYYGWVHNYYDHSAARNAAIDAGSAANRAENALAHLQDALDRQALVIRTLLTACEKAGLYTEQQFRELLDEVDLSDGRLDGKFKPQPAPRECPSCSKVNSKRAVSCMYCGAILERREIV
jgi:hypothetical protein